VCHCELREYLCVCVCHAGEVGALLAAVGPVRRSSSANAASTVRFALCTCPVARSSAVVEERSWDSAFSAQPRREQGLG